MDSDLDSSTEEVITVQRGNENEESKDNPTESTISRVVYNVAEILSPDENDVTIPDQKSTNPLLIDGPSTCVKCNIADMPHTPKQNLPAQYCGCYMHTKCAETLITNGIERCSSCKRKIDISKGQSTTMTIKFHSEKTFRKCCSTSFIPLTTFISISTIVLIVIALLLGWTARLLYCLATGIDKTETVFQGTTKSVGCTELFWPDIPTGTFLFVVIYCLTFCCISMCGKSFLKRCGGCCKCFEKWFGCCRGTHNPELVNVFRTNPYNNIHNLEGVPGLRKLDGNIGKEEEIHDSEGRLHAMGQKIKRFARYIKDNMKQ